VIGAFPDSDSNDNDDQRRALEALGEIARDAELHHLIVVDGAGHSEQGRARGASSKADWADALWNLQVREGTDTRTLLAAGRGVNGAVSYERDADGGLISRMGSPDNSLNRVMVALGKSGRPMTVAEIAAATGLTQPALRSALERLDEQGSVVRAGKRGLAELWTSPRRTL
jgi:DNA-binding transcriptional ArsR family regulator